MTENEQFLLSSSFVDTARNLEFDEVQYSRLVAALEGLAGEWAGKDLVERQVVAELFILPSVLRGSAHRLSGREVGRRMSNAAEELETLVFRILTE
jgi:hypothetical protein